jgi:hypothetical protein
MPTGGRPSLADWLKRKAAAATLGASRNPRRFEHAGERVTSAVQRKGVWQEDQFVADGQKEYGEEKQGVTPWKVRYWDDEGCLVDEGANHEGHLRTRFRLVDANTMEMSVSIVKDPPTGNAMVRRYSRDGDPLDGAVPRLPDELPGGDGASAAPAVGSKTARLRQIFQRADRDGNGSLTRAELILRMRQDAELAEILQLPQKVGDEDRDAFEGVFQQMDRDDDREVTVEEFVGYLSAYRGATAPSGTGAEAATEHGALTDDAKCLPDSSAPLERLADDDAPATAAAPPTPLTKTETRGGDQAKRPAEEAPDPAPVAPPATAPPAQKQPRRGALARVGLPLVVIVALFAAIWRRRVLLRFLTRGR